MLGMLRDRAINKPPAPWIQNLSFTQTVNLSYAVTLRCVTPAVTCSVSSSPVQFSSGGAQSVKAVAKTAPLTTSVAARDFFLPGANAGGVGVNAPGFDGATGATASSCRHGCDRNGLAACPGTWLQVFVVDSYDARNTGRNLYATVTATSGSLSHNPALQGLVQ